MWDPPRKRRYHTCKKSLCERPKLKVQHSRATASIHHVEHLEGLPEHVETAHDLEHGDASRTWVAKTTTTKNRRLRWGEGGGYNHTTAPRGVNTIQHTRELYTSHDNPCVDSQTRENVIILIAAAHLDNNAERHHVRTNGGVQPIPPIPHSLHEIHCLCTNPRSRVLSTLLHLPSKQTRR